MSDKTDQPKPSPPEKPKGRSAKPKPKRTKSPGPGISIPGAVALAVLAAGAGALGGAALSRAYMPAQDAIDLSPVETQIADLNKARSQTEAKLNRLETAQDRLAKKSAPEPADLSGILDRLDALEQAEAPAADLSGLETRLSALEAGEIAAGTDTDFSDLFARLDALENEPRQSSGSVDLDDIKRRLTALENKPETVAARDIRTIPPFPKQAVLDALETPDPDKKKNWFQRAIDSQITIVDDEHLKTVDTITTLLEQGDLDGALIEIDTLPTAAQDALADWLKSVTGERAK